VATARILILTLLFTAAAAGSQKYVTASATGGGAGTEGSPWTLAQAASLATLGDTVNVQSGTYTTPLVFSNSGAVGAQIMYRKWGAARPLVSMNAVTTTNGLAFIGVSYITWQSIDVKFTNSLSVAAQTSRNMVHLVSGSHHIAIDSCQIYTDEDLWAMKGARTYVHGIFQEGAHHITVTDCRISRQRFNYFQVHSATAPVTKWVRDTLEYAWQSNCDFNIPTRNWPGGQPDFTDQRVYFLSCVFDSASEEDNLQFEDDYTGQWTDPIGTPYHGKRYPQHAGYRFDDCHFSRAAEQNVDTKGGYYNIDFNYCTFKTAWGNDNGPWWGGSNDCCFGNIELLYPNPADRNYATESSPNSITNHKKASTGWHRNLGCAFDTTNSWQTMTNGQQNMYGTVMNPNLNMYSREATGLINGQWWGTGEGYTTANPWPDNIYTPEPYYKRRTQLINTAIINANRFFITTTHSSDTLHMNNNAYYHATAGVTNRVGIWDGSALNYTNYTTKAGWNAILQNSYFGGNTSGKDSASLWDVDPQFTGSGSNGIGTYQIGSGSPLRGAAGPVARITQVTDQGNTIRVDYPYPFRVGDSELGYVGDSITWVGPSGYDGDYASAAEILAINGNILTLSRTVYAEPGDSIFFVRFGVVWRDIGAWQYGWNRVFAEGGGGGEPPETIPDVPEGIYPADEATGVAQPITFRWTSEAGATKYWLCVSTDDWGTFVVNNNALTDTFYTLSGLLPGQVAKWNVAAGNALGWSAWFTEFSFTAGAVASQTVNLDWNKQIVLDTLTADATVSVSNLQRISNVLVLKNPDGRTVTWDPVIQWPGLSIPPQPAIGKTNVYYFVREGSVVHGVVLGIYEGGSSGSGVTQDWVLSQLTLYLKKSDPVNATLIRDKIIGTTRPSGLSALSFDSSLDQYIHQALMQLDSAGLGAADTSVVPKAVVAHQGSFHLKEIWPGTGEAGVADGQDADSIRGRPVSPYRPAARRQLIFEPDSGDAGEYVHAATALLDTTGQAAADTAVVMKAVVAHDGTYHLKEIWPGGSDDDPITWAGNDATFPGTVTMPGGSQLSSGGYDNASGYVQVNNHYVRGNIYMLDKATTGWLTPFARNTSGAEAVWDISSIGFMTLNNYLDAESSTGDTRVRVGRTGSSHVEMFMDYANFYPHVRSSSGAWLGIEGDQIHLATGGTKGSRTTRLSITDDGSTFTGNVAVQGAGSTFGPFGIRKYGGSDGAIWYFDMNGSDGNLYIRPSNTSMTATIYGADWSKLFWLYTNDYQDFDYVRKINGKKIDRIDSASITIAMAGTSWLAPSNTDSLSGPIAFDKTFIVDSIKVWLTGASTDTVTFDIRYGPDPSVSGYGTGMQTTPTPIAGGNTWRCAVPDNATIPAGQSVFVFAKKKVGTPKRATVILKGRWISG
jgi:hypothetical protein